MANTNGPSSDEQPCHLPSWCRPKEVKTTLSKTGCPVLDELAEKIHQSGSCSGHQSPQQRSIPRASLANAAARMAARQAGTGAVPAAGFSVSASASRHEAPPPLSRSRSFPAVSGQRPPPPGSGSSGVMELDVVGDGCSADAVRQAADSVTADDPDFKETVPYLTTVSESLKEDCLKQLIALKQKLLREFAEVLCLIERKYTLKYAESLSEAREQQTVARYYQMSNDKNRKIADNMAGALHRRRMRCRLGRCFRAWHRLARDARRKKNGSGAEENPSDQQQDKAGGDSDGIDIEYTRTEEIGNKVYERKLTAQLTKALERDCQAKECRKYHMGPPCPGKVCKCKRQTERLRYRRVEQLECELEMGKRREAQLMDQKHHAEAKYRQAILRGMNVIKDGSQGDTPPSECPPTKTTTICRRRVDSSDSTLPPARIRRSQSEARRSPRPGGGGARGCRRRARSRPAPACRGTQTRHLSCVAPLPPNGWPRNAECITSKTQRRPRVRVCAERQGPRRTVLTEARSRAAAAAAAADGLGGIASDSSVTVMNYEPRRKTEVTEKWRHLSRN